MTDDGQKAEASAERSQAANLGDIDVSDQGRVNLQSQEEGHTKPKPHNKQSTREFNGLAYLFQVLSGHISPVYFDRIFGGSTLLGLLAFAYWFVTEISLQFPNADISFSWYVLPSILVCAVGIVYLTLRSDSQCPDCETPFALRKSEYEIDRDKLSGKPDDLLIRREWYCTQCELKDEETGWTPDPEQQS